MTDTLDFEAAFEGRLRAYAEFANRPFDAATVAHAAVGIAGRPMRRALGRDRLLSAVIVIAVGASIAGVAIFGGPLLRPAPLVVASPSPTASGSTPEPSPSPVATPAATRLVALPWVAQDVPGADGLVEIFNLWRVGDVFVGVAHGTPQEADQRIPTTFMRSADGLSWETVPSPTRGLEVEAGAVEEGVLWVVGNLGPERDPKRGIWTTRDGVTWERLDGVDGLDFGMGQVTDLSHATSGWLALVQHALDAESAVNELYRSTDGVHWAKAAFPYVGPLSSPTGLVSDGDRWVLVTDLILDTTREVWALESADGIQWTRTRVAVLAKGAGSSAATFGPNGFVIVGQDVDGETPHPLAWTSRDGTMWTRGQMDGLPEEAGETGLRQVIALDHGYLAAGYRLSGVPTFWTSPDGLTWSQFADLPDQHKVEVSAVAASDDRFIVGGQAAGAGTAFIWAASR